MKPQIKPYGRNRIRLHLPADHPALEELRADSIFQTTYRQYGRVVAIDLAFEAGKRAELEERLDPLPFEQ